jgi:hypothetical protein
LLALIVVGVIVILLLPAPAATGDTATATTDTASRCDGQWNVVTDALGATDTNVNAYLAAIATISTKNVWAVGSYADFNAAKAGQQPLVEHWDGRAWEQVNITNKANENGILKAISAVSADDIWAVGEIQNFITSPLIEHWNGKQWNIIPTPSLPNGSTTNALLSSVAALATDNVWAVGSYSNYTTSPQSPAQGGAASGSTATDQAGATSSNGDQSGATYKTFIEHWDGQQWSIVASPNVGQTSNTLQAITAISPNDIWAVGTQDNAPLTIHWDGNTWQAIPNATLPRTPSSSTLNAIARVPGTPYLWAVGSFQEAVSLSAGQQYQTLVEYWDGQQWNFVPNIASAQQGNTLNGIVAIAANDVWAVGQDGNNQLLTEHWNGKKWQIVSMPNNEQAEVGGLSAISAASGHNVWSVGKYGTSTSVNAVSQSLVEQYC